MITSIAVDGFRSLMNFGLALQPGLNVIVGPNGAGKSNLISFLDFLGAFIDDGLNSAIAVAQGAGSVFSSERFSESEAVLKFSINGDWKTVEGSDRYHRRNQEDRGTYKYQCEIVYSKAIPSVYVHAENVEVNYASGKPSVIVHRNTYREDREYFHNVRFDISEEVRNSLYKYYTDKEKITIETIVERWLRTDRSILNALLHDIIGIDEVAIQLSAYRSMNIDPSIARKPTPVGPSIELQPTGEGLAGALYNIKRNSFYSTRGQRYRYLSGVERSKPDFDTILSWCREVNPAISRIEVSLDFVEAQFRPTMTLNFGSGHSDFSFTRISDGTVKWLSLVTILLSEPSLSIIEEPENFLHPAMQEAFIALCRQVLEDRAEDRTIIVSTHSPTLLDCCDPTEVTLFDTLNGQTRASKVANYEELRQKIENSRFGLGHYFRTGALYGQGSGFG